MNDLRLVVFDVDGTLVDSQGDIVGSMTAAFADQGLAEPARASVLSIVGLSLDVAMGQLAPHATPAEIDGLVAAYKAAYMARRAAKGSRESSPMYPVARAALDALNAQDETLLGIATGKSRRGLDSLLDGHNLRGMFVTEQVADHHPSKPHSAMLQSALAETGVPASRAVMVGDTSFDMDMARAAGMTAVGVTWGYHSREKLVSADVVVTRFEDLVPTIEEILG